MNDSKFDALVATNNNPNAINFYIVNTYGSLIGRAGAITSRNLVMIDSYVTTGVSSHEFGHCLNLWHTFQGTANQTSGCPELINGSNCTSCGDYVCDTPADAKIGISGGYNPDMTNNMSYCSPYYLDHFSQLQGKRMRDALNGSAILQPVLGNLCKYISGSDTVCENTNQSYTISNNTNSIVTWSVSSNLQIVSQSNTTIIIKSLSNLSSTGTITASINGQSVLKTVKIGVLPITNYGIQGPSNPNVLIGFSSSFSVRPVSGATNYYWSIVSNPNCGCYTNADGFLICPSGTILPSIQGSSNNAYVQWGNCPGDYSINCSAVNDCGLAGIGNMSIYVSRPGSGGGNNGEDLPCQYGYRLQQNPIKNQNIELSIAGPPGPCPAPSSGYKTVKIFNLQGILVFENKYKDDKTYQYLILTLKKDITF